MSFAVQEQVLLDLLFDRERRAVFRADRSAALAGYALSAAERRDFATLRIEALDLDAGMRVGFILAQYCRSYPLSFSLVSSLPGGLTLLRQRIDAMLMRTPPAERLSRFGMALRDTLRQEPGFADEHDRALTLSIVEAELSMAWTAEAARQAALGGPLPAPLPLPADWLRRPARLAPLTSAGVLPRPYAELRRVLCPCTGSELWRRLGREPFTSAQRQRLFAQLELRLLVARAVISHVSACDPAAEHVTVELGEGFARLLPHLDGRSSVGALLAQLRAAGADAALLSGVEEGFCQLGQQGMLSVL